MADDPKTLETKTPEQERSEFDEAFTSLAATLREPGEKPAGEATAEEKAAADKAAADKATADAAAAEKATADKAAADKATADAAAAAAAAAEKATADKAAADAAAAAAAAPKPTPGEEAARAELAEANRKLKELEDAKPVAKTPEQIAAEEAAKKPIYTAEENEFLAEYHKNWETVAKGEELKRRGEYNALVKHIFEQIQARYEPVLQFMEDLAPKTQHGEILRLVPDYDTVRDAAVAWAGKQTGFLKDAYARVVAEGSPQDVADMIATFKTATGYKTAAPAVVAAAAPAAAGGAVTAAADEAAKAAAAAALRPVDSQRTARTEGADPNDFNTAFAEFAAAK